MAQLPKRAAGALADVRGGVRLVVAGVRGVTGIVEAMHHRIARISPPFGSVQDEPTRGITGLVYRSIKGTTGLVGHGLDAALAGVQAVLGMSLQGLPEAEAPPRRDAVVSALNGVVGDHLARTGNPLAIRMELRTREAQGPSGPKILLMVHGLCMNDLQWSRDGHDHGQSLGRSLGYTPVYARYNTGRHISASGHDLAEAIERLLQAWPVPVENLTILGHSMGGLVARSAVFQASEAGMAWPTRLKGLVFLGTPHHGAPLERGGNWLHRGLGISPYLAPFTRLSGMRSEGITDLRHGSLLEADRAGGRFTLRDTRSVLPLPQGVQCYAVAGTLGRDEDANEWMGDGLVPLASALGRHARATRDLHIPPSHQWIARGVHHLDLLGSDAVYRRLRKWLAA
ncbi:MAG: alpha/beta hydrolase [Ramlibacter sp.]